MRVGNPVTVYGTGGCQACSITFIPTHNPIFTGDLDPLLGNGTNKQDMVECEEQAILKKRSLSW